MYINKKAIICIVLCIWIVFMAVGFAIYSEQLTITGTSHVDSRWDLRITNITTSDIVGDATEKAAPSYTNTTARLKVSLINPTDSITYNIKIKNLGNLSARVSNYTVTMGESDAIVYEVKGLLKDQVLDPNEEQLVKIKISFKTGYIGDPSNANKTSTVKVIIDYVQNLDGSGATGEGETITNAYTAYSIGDTIEFAGSNWNVIEDSGRGQDYVTLLRVSRLAGTEITSKYVYKGNTGNNTMSYYWSSTCHSTDTYGTDAYADTDTSGCGNHNDFAGSKIKAALDEYAANTLGSSNLKEVDGYKIRILNLNDLQNNLGWKSGVETRASASGNSVPSFVLDGRDEWTMIPDVINASDLQNNSNVYRIKYDNMLRSSQIISTYSVRPVINLYKSAI